MVPIAFWVCSYLDGFIPIHLFLDLSVLFGTDAEFPDQFFLGIWQKPDDMQMLPHMVMSFRFSRFSNSPTSCFCFHIPYEAFVYADAIWKTNWRLLVSHRHLLQWNPSHHITSGQTKNLFRTYISMWFPVLLALWFSNGCNTNRQKEGDQPAFSRFLDAGSGAVAWKISLPDKRKMVSLDEKQKLFLK